MKVERRTLWCCSAAQPSVARRAPHLINPSVSQRFRAAASKLLVPYGGIRYFNEAVLSGARLGPSNRSAVCVRRRPDSVQVNRLRHC